MRKFLVLTAVSILITGIMTELKGQVSVRAIPYSFRTKLKSASEIRTSFLQRVSVDSLKAVDSLFAVPNRFAVLEYLTVDLKEKGSLSWVGDSMRVWQYRIVSPNALALGVRMGYFRVPAGARLFLYNAARTRLLGAYTSLNNKPDGFLAIQPLEGDEIILDYEEPVHAEFEGTVVLQAVSKAYRSLSTTLVYNDINCPGWEKWQTVKHAICRIIFDDVDGSYYCSGSLINNTRFDATPYFLTANHCISTQFSAASVVVYFNYETDTCNGSVTNTNQTVSGATLCAHASETDFSLLKLTESPPESYQPYFAGWDVTGAEPEESAVIHHPKGLNKSIAYSQQKGKMYPYSINWDDGSTSPPYTHWEVVFTNGNTNSGSSGSPLLNADQQIIGQLHGGDNTTNYYGALAVSWSLNLLPSRQLKVWLDPDNTGAKKLPGTDGKVFPRADFVAMPELPCIQAAVLLKNLSKQNPQHYQWQIIPATFEFLPDSNQQVTTDTSANPVIAFLEARDYVIRLVAKNSFGSDTLVRTISVGNIFTDFTQFPTDSPLCGKAVKNLLVEASGSYTFDFSFDSVRYSFSQQGNRLNLTLKDTVINDSTFSDIIRVTARHGLCRYTAERSLTVQNIPYDRIRNELALHPGLNGPFDNTCASYEAGEPHPNDGGCTVPNNWCYNDVNPDTVVFRSLWFTFIGPASGQVNIHTRGLDTRVALYEANTHEDLIRDNYRLLAAVDNTLSGNEAVLSDIAVIPGKRYWLQVDANAYAVGTFTINLFSLTIELSPNPVHQWVKIILPVAASATGTLSIVSANGKVHLQKNLNFSPENNLIEFNCADLPPGLYIVRYNSNLGSFAAKLMVVHP